MAFKYTIDFVTQADLAAAEKTEKAVAKVGTEVDKTGGKLKDLGTAGEEGGKGLVDSLSDAGDKGGEGLLGKLNGKLAAIGPAALVPAAIGIGTAIGQALGTAIEDVWTGEIEDNLKKTFALTWSQQAALVSEQYGVSVRAALRDVHQGLLADQQAFFKELNNAAPENAGDWLDAIGTKADQAGEKLRGLSEIQTALLKLGKSRAEQDYLDQKQAIATDPNLTKTQRLEANAANEERKAAAEAEIRHQERLAKARELGEATRNKAQEFSDLNNAVGPQTQRVNVADRAEANAQYDITQKKEGGATLTKADEDRIREMYFKKASQETGVNVEPGQDEKGALKKLVDARDKAQAELAKIQTEAAVKAKALALEELADSDATERTRRRTEQTAQAAIEEQRMKDFEASKPAPLPAPPQDPLKGPSSPVNNGQTSPEETQAMRDLLTKAAQTTGNAGQKANLEELKRALSDGGSVEELKQATALIQQMQGGSNAALRQLAEALRQQVAATAASNQSIKGEIDSLKASIAALQYRTS